MSTSIYDPRLAIPDTSALGGTTLIGGDHTHRRISWAGIFGGVILAIAVQLLLSLLGAGIGLGIGDTNAGGTPSASTLGISAGVWWIGSSCVALLIGGYVAAWLAGVESRFDGLLHGMVTWGVATLLTFWLLTSAIGGIIGGGFTAIGSIASAAGSGVADMARPVAQAAGLSPDMIRQQAQAYLEPANPDPAAMSPPDAQTTIAADLATYARGGADAPAAKEKIVTIMAAQMKISHDDAARRFDDVQTRLSESRDQAVQTARNAAGAAAAAMSKTSFAAFGVLLAGLISAAIGGACALRRRVLLIRETIVGRAGGDLAARRI